MKKFRPQDFNGKFKLKNYNVGQWNWVPFRNYSTHFERISAQLHYLGEHAPKPVRKKWWRVWDRFFKRYHKKL